MALQSAHSCMENAHETSQLADEKKTPGKIIKPTI